MLNVHNRLSFTSTTLSVAYVFTLLTVKKNIDENEISTIASSPPPISHLISRKEDWYCDIAEEKVNKFFLFFLKQQVIFTSIKIILIIVLTSNTKFYDFFQIFLPNLLQFVSLVVFFFFFM